MKVNIRGTLSLLGEVLLLISGTFALPAFVAILTSTPTRPFILPMILSILIGAALRLLDREPEIGLREAFLLVSLAWLAVVVLGALPYMIEGTGSLADPINALFESMSGFTTTGATVLDDFAVPSAALMFWRQFTQWLGGMGIIVLALAILPRLSVGGAQLMGLEAPGPQLQKLAPHIRRTARAFWGIYLSLTALETGLLFGLHLAGLAPNMNLYNALIHSFTTLSTGGFSPMPRSIQQFSPAAQWVIIVFMFFAGTNFALFWYVAAKRDWRIFKNEEFRWYFSITAVLTVLIALTIYKFHGMKLMETVRQALFQVLAIVTTTGYATMDFSRWPVTAQLILVAAMFIGGSSGSTAGSVKIVRWVIAVKATIRELFLAIHPDGVKAIRLGGKVVDEKAVRGVLGFIVLYFVIFWLSTVFVMWNGTVGSTSPLTFGEAMSAVAATLGNVGPGIGRIGPMSNYLIFPASTKILLILLMWLGRLEIITVLVLFSRKYWR